MCFFRHILREQRGPSLMCRYQTVMLLENDNCEYEPLKRQATRGNSRTIRTPLCGVISQNITVQPWTRVLHAKGLFSLIYKMYWHMKTSRASFPPSSSRITVSSEILPVVFQFQTVQVSRISRLQIGQWKQMEHRWSLPQGTGQK